MPKKSVVDVEMSKFVVSNRFPVPESYKRLCRGKWAFLAAMAVGDSAAVARKSKAADTDDVKRALYDEYKKAHAARSYWERTTGFKYAIEDDVHGFWRIWRIE